MDTKGPHSKISCLKCRHFFSTYNVKMPRGCKLYGIQSTQFPSDVVKKESGSECMGYEAREAKIDPKSLEDRWKRE